MRDQGHLHSPAVGRRRAAHRVVLGALLGIAALAASAGDASAQPDTQLWTELKLSWVHSHHLTYGLDIEPKVRVSDPGDEGSWATVDLTPSVEYRRGWLDFLGEFLVGRTRQSDDVRSTEITPRVGLRFHILPNFWDEVIRERRASQRVIVSNLARLEARNLFYSAADKPNASTLRFRDRVEFQCALTRPRVTDDGVTYAMADLEWFWTLDDVDERYASKQRVRGGVGYRRSAEWRFEGLVIWNRSRNTVDDGFTSSGLVFDVVVRRVW